MESIRLNGRRFGSNEVDEITATGFPLLSEATLEEIRSFLYVWWNGSNYIEVHTSGSTGTPKVIRLSKKTVSASADKTIDYFGLQPESNVLLCLPSRYIAGKLMLVRAIRGGMNIFLAEPNLQPLKNLNAQPDFAAMIPAQVIAALNQPGEKQKLAAIPQVLIGGSTIEPDIEEELAKLPNRFFHSYGMTETATHVALREIGKSRSYAALDGIRFSLDNRGCLIIEAEHLPEKIITNDLVELHDESCFTWLGRNDNAIISGGIKHIPELLEAKIAPLIVEPFFLIAAPDPVLGQKLVIVVESVPWNEERIRNFNQELSKVLSRHEIPKDVRFQEKFQRTGTGKVKRMLM